MSPFVIFVLRMMPVVALMALAVYMMYVATRIGGPNLFGPNPNWRRVDSKYRRWHERYSRGYMLRSKWPMYWVGFVAVLVALSLYLLWFLRLGGVSLLVATVGLIVATLLSAISLGYRLPEGSGLSHPPR